jgi:hypothetical protein
MMILAGIGLLLLAAVCVLGAMWLVNNVRFNGIKAKEKNDE